MDDRVQTPFDYKHMTRCDTPLCDNIALTVERTHKLCAKCWIERETKNYRPAHKSPKL